MSKKHKNRQAPKTEAKVVPMVQVTKYECGVDAVLRRAKEKALRQLAGRMG